MDCATKKVGYTEPFEQIGRTQFRSFPVHLADLIFENGPAPKERSLVTLVEP